jgi:hypothetical protein
MHTGRLWSLVLALTLLLGVVTRLKAQGKPLRPSKYACPVTGNLFPSLERSGDNLKFTFPNNADAIPSEKVRDSFARVARRISLSVVAPDTENVKIPFECKMAQYKGPHMDWGVHSGSFIVKADGSTNCYFLGPSAGLPGNIPIIEFNLTVPPGVEVKEVRFSSQGIEYISQDCPWPEMEKELKAAFEESRSSPQDESKTGRFLILLEKALPEVDCVGKGGGIGPAPAWTLADLFVCIDWIRYLSEKMEKENNLALRVFSGMYNRASGVLAEEMDDLIWQILRDRPLFILANWGVIKNNRRTILESKWMNSPNSTLEMVEIYRDIALKEPKYKSACEEIISILNEKSQGE